MQEAVRDSSWPAASRAIIAGAPGDDFGSDPKLGPALHDYYHLLKDYIMRRGHFTFVLHRRGRYAGFGF